MSLPHRHRYRPTHRACWRSPVAWAIGMALSAGAWAQAGRPASATTANDSWQACAAIIDGQTRLTCFDRWAVSQQGKPGAGQAAAPTAAEQAGAAPASANATAQAAAAAAVPAQPAVVAGAQAKGCDDRRYSPLSRFWELERATDCSTFGLRGYRPISFDLVASDSVNQQPSSSAEGRTALTQENYRKSETRIQLSARVKVAKDLLTGGSDTRSDSLWVGFTQQSYWQFFSPELSRPFRTTDYEPEAMYVYPADIGLPGGWRLRYTGLGISHQSNGRELPLSRSWNRGYLMTGFELDDRFSVEAKIWKRLFGKGDDDNPNITDFIGRGELTGTWNVNKANTVAATLRHPLRSGGKGSARLDYFRAFGRGAADGNLNDLRFHVQYFTGYGDSLLDYNRKRNVLSVGLALVDW